MESKLNYKAIDKYSQKFSDNLIASFFKDKDHISGKEILNLFELRQVNLFILQYIFESWKQEMEHMRSPYFDYDNEEVKSSLEKFMNLLSQHIRVSKDDFNQLLNLSVKDTILLICSPYDYYRERLKKQGQDQIELSALKDNSKYIQINKHLHEALVKKLESKEVTSVDSNQTVKYLDEVIAEISAPPEDFEEYEAQFSKIAPLDVNSFYEEAREEEPVKPVTLSQEQLQTVNDRFSKQSRTLMDEISDGNTTNLAELHRKKKITSLKQYISINQRFMFVNELFGGDTQSFNTAIDQLEEREDYDAALDYLIKNFAKKHNWLMDSDEVVEFLEVVNKRFD